MHFAVCFPETSAFRISHRFSFLSMQHTAWCIVNKSPHVFPSVRPGNETMVRCLLEEGANAAWTDARGMTPVAHAAHGGNLLAVRALLKAKATGGSGR